MLKPNKNTHRVCGWCLSVVPSKIPRPTKAFCCAGCRDADALFEMQFSDEEISLHHHYQNLTNGKTPEGGWKS